MVAALGPAKGNRMKLDHIVMRESSETTTTTATTTTAENITTTTQKNVVSDQLGVTNNSASDGDTLFVAGIGNAFAIIALVVIFSALRLTYPTFYSRIDPASMPFRPSSDFFAWFPASFALPVDQVIDCCGLDTGMFIEFCNFGMRVGFYLGVPLMVVLLPTYYIVGSEKQNWVQQYSIHNLEYHDDAFFYLGFVVWFVVIAVDTMIWKEQRKFIERRIRWLTRLPKPRATTLLVTDIPSEYRSDELLKAYYSQIFPGDAIEYTYVVKNTGRLPALLQELKVVERRILELTHQEQENSAPSNARDLTAKDIEYHRNVRRDLRSQAEAERKDVLAMCETYGAKVNGSEGFVTFKSRRDSEMALRMQLEADACVFQMQAPPDPIDVRYADMLVEPETRMSWHFVGYLCVVCLFFAFIPIVTIISAFINLEALDDIQFVHWILENSPIIEGIVEGMLASLAISITLGSLPGALMSIYENFFALRSSRSAQLYVQQSYFWFQVVFVLLITCLGASLWDSAQDIFAKGLFDILEDVGDKLPETSSFYMYYMILQTSLNVVQLTRYSVLVQFLALSLLLGDKDAKVFVEPGSQGFNGMGARNARLTFILVIGLVFCTITPLILVTTFVFFLVCRVVYGYLLVFAEELQVDLGGVLWVQQLKSFQQCIIFFVVTMAGFLFSRGPGSAPGVIAATSGVYAVWSHYKFRTDLLWETLPFRVVSELPPPEQEYDLRPAIPRVNTSKLLAPDLSPSSSGSEAVQSPRPPPAEYIQPELQHID